MLRVQIADTPFCSETGGIRGNQFGQNLADAVSFIRPINAGRGNEYDLADAGGSGGFENLEGAAHVEVEEIKRVFVAAIFVDAVPGGYVNDEVAAAKYLRELRPVQNRCLDKHRSLFQIPRRANIQNDRRVALAEQTGGGRGFRAGRAREKNSIVQEISNSIT